MFQDSSHALLVVSLDRAERMLGKNVMWLHLPCWEWVIATHNSNYAPLCALESGQEKFPKAPRTMITVWCHTCPVGFLQKALKKKAGTTKTVLFAFAENTQTEMRRSKTKGLITDVLNKEKFARRSLWSGSRVNRGAGLCDLCWRTATVERERVGGKKLEKEGKSSTSGVMSDQARPNWEMLCCSVVLL